MNGLFTFCIYLVGYIAIPTIFILFEAFIGFGEAFEREFGRGNEIPPFVLILIWPVAFSVMLMVTLYSFAAQAKKKRLEKNRERTRIRIAIEKEQENIIEKINEELGQYNEEKKMSMFKFGKK